MTQMRVLTLISLVSAAAWADAKVVLFPAVGTPAEVTLSGRVLKHASTGGSTTLSRNLRRLTVSNWEGAEVTVSWAGRTQTARSGKDGHFAVTFAAGGTPFEVGLGSAQAAVSGAEPGVAFADVLAAEAPFFVVSDLDDTLVVTDVLDKAKLLESALLKDENDQPVVEGMPQFYRCLREVAPARPAFALVSGSPIQYVGRVASFLTRHDFPPMGLYLRELGPTTLTGYKQPLIRALLQALPHKAVLVGDSGEQDPEVYAQLRSEFPGRVLAIYIRNAGRAEDKSRFKDMVLFNAPAEAARDAAAKGLASKACVEQAFVTPAKADAGAK